MSFLQGGGDSIMPSIVVDGGPHTLWWSIQNPDGSDPGPVDDYEGGGHSVRPAPIPLFLANLQPNAKFIVTLAEPVRRMYSDYYFLTANSVAMDTDGKSPEDFHEIALQQVRGPA